MTSQLSHLFEAAGLGMFAARARALAPSSRLVRTPGGAFGVICSSWLDVMGLPWPARGDGPAGLKKTADGQTEQLPVHC